MSTNDDSAQHGAWFSISFPISVDNLFTFKDQCEQASGALHTADGDTIRASSIVGQQEALLVEECQHDLQITSNVCEEISNDLKALANAVSELAWSMKSVHDEYKGIAQKAQGCGLMVEGDKVILFDESDDGLTQSFNELQAQAEVQQLNYERAEYVFSLALDNLKVDVYEQWIEPVFDALKEQFILDDKHPLAKALPYAVGLLDMGGQITIGSSMTYFKRLYEPPQRLLRQRRPVEVGLPARETWAGTNGHTIGLSDRHQNWEGCRPDRGGRRRRHHCLQHLPNRYRAAPRMERGPQDSTSGCQRNCDRGSYVGWSLARSQRRRCYRRRCLRAFRPRWRCRWRRCRRRHRRGGRALLWRKDK